MNVMLMSGLWIVLSALCNAAAGTCLKYTREAVGQAQGSSLSALLETGAATYFFGTLVAYALALLTYFLALRHLPISIVYILIVSGTAVMLVCADHFLFGTAITPRMLLGFAITVAGLSLIVK
ncbi:MAG: hypothetical protein HRT82_03855 [Henriciella sp.]|nr:hypothetical protein [Henriciella sp.]